MNQTTMDYLFGPLPEIYCLYFYGMSVFTFILLVFALVNVVYLVFSKKTNKQLIVPGLSTKEILFAFSFSHSIIYMYI